MVVTMFAAYFLKVLRFPAYCHKLFQQQSNSFHQSSNFKIYFRKRIESSHYPERAPRVLTRLLAHPHRMRFTYKMVCFLSSFGLAGSSWKCKYDERSEMERKLIGVIGGGSAGAEILAMAEETGRLIAKNGCFLICGGMSGVMEAAAKGANEAGGTTIGILPHADRHEANPYIDIPIATGLGEGRNLVIIRTADILIAIDGEYGTLSELAFGLKMKKPVIGLHTWDIPGIIKAGTPIEAVGIAMDILNERKDSLGPG
jgi:hypothetical protein